MSVEKKHWRLSTPFRRFSGTQDPSPKAKVGRSGSRVSSVYLSDDSSTNGFVIVPEFDYPVEIQTTHCNSHPAADPPPTTPSNSLSHGAVDNYSVNHMSIGSRYSYSGHGQDDDLTQRLSLAYEYIRSMSSGASPQIILSSDPQTLRKQLGVPQHSVFNHLVDSSPDLPNPHTSHGPLASPPTTPPDVSCIQASEKPSLSTNTNTNVYSPPPHPLQPAQSKSVVTSPIGTENSCPCSPLRMFRSTNTTCGTWRSRSSNPEQSKLVKRRFEKTTSTSSLPPFGRQASRRVLRKPGAVTTPSANAHRRQISLPQIKPPSPFRVNIPLHHEWHERRTNFNSSIESNTRIAQFHAANSRRTSGSTEVLASLAWIGTPYTNNRRCHSTSMAFLPDPLSIGIAVEDESISDDVLVDRLEQVRRTSRPCERGSDVSPLRSSANAQSYITGGDGNMGSLSSCPLSSPPTSDGHHSAPLYSPPLSKDTTPDLEDAAVWQAARKAFLCIREIVRTEKKYQEALKMLLNAQTATPPPPSMAPYVLALVQVSETLLRRFIEDPSAWGVSTAFVTSEDELEATMVSWCAVAGAFFTDGDPRSSSSTGKWRLRRSGVIPSPCTPSATKRTSIPLSPQLPPMFSMIRMADEYCVEQQPQTEQTSAVSLQKSEGTDDQSLTSQPPGRKLSVRDLAIQPIQRVMRYVLLYRDLLDCTPATSPPRLLVERALEAATRIASHCDRAQRNPAFCHAS